MKNIKEMKMKSEKDFKSKQRKIDTPQQKHQNHVSSSNIWNIQQGPDQSASDKYKNIMNI